VLCKSDWNKYDGYWGLKGVKKVGKTRYFSAEKLQIFR